DAMDLGRGRLRRRICRRQLHLRQLRHRNPGCGRSRRRLDRWCTAAGFRPQCRRSAMLQFGFLITVLGLLELWKTHYVLVLFALGRGLMLLSSTKVPFDFKVTRLNMFSSVDDCAETSVWERTARFLSVLVFAGGGSV